MKSQTVKQVVSSLQQDKKRLDTLTSVLQQQYEAMSERNTVQLETLNQQALALMEALSHSHQQRELWFSQLGLRADKPGMQQLVSLLPAAVQPAVQRLLHELAVKSRLCHSLNEKSGKLLAAQRELLGKLTGLSKQDHYPAMPFVR